MPGEKLVMAYGHSVFAEGRTPLLRGKSPAAKYLPSVFMSVFKSVFV
jgi:hypothetical protein